MKRSLWLAALALAACTAGSAGSLDETLEANAEPLRTAFDEAAGKVRAVFLVSPT